ncbi:filamin-A-like isoform X3 [Physella acuta]|uniref:filamin-A-like isoform X3 n=1 Tax=Physella acuta TaxID=109671 RepID=UPI0027DD0F5A|nr:filamin-A-like isoform X3 [Physella acuta]
MSGTEDQWIAIQAKTFLNWTNEQLSIGNRSIENLSVDLCDGVKLVALVEALQFKKIGKVYSKPTSRIQMLNNVSLALNAIAADNVKLVNIGTDDIVGGNLKLILGLLWHLIIRYQISSSKSKAPPKQLMLTWFKNALPGLTITNFTSNWRDGIALHALLEYLKPGLSPKWAELSPKDSLQNCRTAMQLAKEHLNVPRVISPEDFSSPDLDELSAMTYLSYFIRKISPGYYNTLNWACKQLKTTNISNLTTDWNDGYYLCSLVHSLGGEVPGWPNINRKDHVATCQLGIESAQKLGIDPILTATDLSDPNVDHLAVMAYLCKFQKITPRKDKSEKVHFHINAADVDTQESKVKTWVSGPTTSPPCQIAWANRTATCTFQPTEIGLHKIFVQYDNTDIRGCPITFTVQHDLSKVKITGSPNPCRVGKPHTIEIFCQKELQNSLEIRVTSPNGELSHLNTDPIPEGLKAVIRPSMPGTWSYQTLVGSLEVSTVKFSAFDPLKAWLSGPEKGVVGESVTFTVNNRDCGNDDLEAEVTTTGGRILDDVHLVKSKDIHNITFNPRSAGVYRVKASIRGEVINGSPKTVEVVDPGQILVTGEGLTKGTKGVEAYFYVNKQGLDGEISVVIEVEGQNVPAAREKQAADEFGYMYIPPKVGFYKIDVRWDGKPVAGSPFMVNITDKSRVILLDNLAELKDESDHVALTYNQTTTFNFDISRAGPGHLTAEVLSPEGKLPVHVTQSTDRATVTFTASHEGDHYIHLYWSEVPLDYSPIQAYCPGPPTVVDASKVVITGKGAESGRATVTSKFIIDGKKAGAGVAKVKLQGVMNELPVDVKPLKYNRYLCSYTSNLPGSFLLYVYWSDVLVPGCPFKINITTKGDVRKVKVTGEGLSGGIFGSELIVYVDTVEAGPGEITAECHSHRQNALCDLIENSDGQYILRITPTEAEKHVLQIRYDGIQVPGSPFILRVGDPPDPSRVRVFGPGIEDGHIDNFQSRFLVDTHGAGAGQLAVKIRGPRGGFRVDMRRETINERIINCRYDPSEAGEYAIHVRWSGVHVPGSPFVVKIVETREQLNRLIAERGYKLHEEQLGWKAEI